MPRRQFLRLTAGFATFVPLVLFLMACNQPKPATRAQALTAQEVYVEFTGTWAIAPDPNDPKFVLAIAPKNVGHRDPFVKAAEGAALQPGVYDLTVPSYTSGGVPALPADSVQTSASPAAISAILSAKDARYIVRLPLPNGYSASGRFISRVGPTYPPAAATEKDYVTGVSLTYDLTTLAGFQLTGTPDTGSFQPLPLHIETPIIRFVIEPHDFDDPVDQCSLHSRESFRDITRLLGVTLFVDFPDNPASCHDSDPQLQPALKRTQGDSTRVHSSWLLATLQSGRLPHSAWAGRSVLTLYPLPAIVSLFIHPGQNCHAPIIFVV